MKAIGLGGAWVLVAIAVCGLTAATLAWNPLRLLLGNRSARLDAPEPNPALAMALASALTKAEALEPESAEMPEMDLSLFEGAAAATNADTNQINQIRQNNAEQRKNDSEIFSTGGDIMAVASERNWPRA